MAGKVAYISLSPFFSFIFYRFYTLILGDRVFESCCSLRSSGPLYPFLFFPILLPLFFYYRWSRRGTSTSYHYSHAVENTFILANLTILHYNEGNFMAHYGKT